MELLFREDPLHSGIVERGKDTTNGSGGHVDERSNICDALLSQISDD
jgi:hypothetical protein